MDSKTERFHKFLDICCVQDVQVWAQYRSLGNSRSQLSSPQDRTTIMNRLCSTDDEGLHPVERRTRYSVRNRNRVIMFPRTNFHVGIYRVSLGLPKILCGAIYSFFRRDFQMASRGVCTTGRRITRREQLVLYKYTHSYLKLSPLLFSHHINIVCHYHIKAGLINILIHHFQFSFAVFMNTAQCFLNDWTVGMCSWTAWRRKES